MSEPVHVGRNELLQCLEAVEPGTSARDVIEQSSCVVFRGGRAYTYNDEVCCRVKSPLPAEWECAVAHRGLLEAVRRIEVDTLEAAQAGDHFLLRGKRKWVKVRLEAKVALPLEGVERPAKGDWKKLPDDFCEGLALVSECVAKDDGDFAVTCVHLAPTHVEACDRFRMARHDMRLPVKPPGVLLRGPEAARLHKLGVTRFCETAGWLHFHTPEGLTVSCRRYPEDYPDLTPHLQFRGKPLKLPKMLAEMVDLGSVFSKENADDDQLNVECSAAGGISVYGDGVSGSGGGTVRKVGYSGPDLKFRVGPKLLAYVLEHFNEVEVGDGRMRASGGNWVYLTCLESAGGDCHEDRRGDVPVRQDAAEGDDPVTEGKSDTSGGGDRRPGTHQRQGRHPLPNGRNGTAREAGVPGRQHRAGI